MSLDRTFEKGAWPKGPRTPYGTSVEKAVLGAPQFPEKPNSDYLPFDKAINLVRDAQPNPLSRSRIVKELRKNIASLCHDKDNAVKFFTAIGTPLDVFHGVDAFFEQAHRRVTIDISLKEKESHKADVLMFVELDEEGRVTITPEEMRHVAENVARQLNEH